ncbi:MAG: L-seryl-tRNA(Sec) selenium transferase [Clostridiales bacterium 36_14]|nr:MAG: L-seryl-tRNA(Sec) selenium transferase [Clostridiales bacterium 36_14]
MNKNLLFRSIPKVDILLEEQEIQDLIDVYGREFVMDVIREEMDALRTFIGKCEEEEKAKAQIGMLTQNIKRHAGKLHEPNMKMVINGTGTVLHTNLGRAPISKEHVERLAGIVSGYSNLEYNLEAGTRGERYSHFEKLLCKLTGAEAAMAVNNNAAAVMLILSSMAKGGEVVVSRGELVEIGGKFRIPDVMEQSGASLVEVETVTIDELIPIAQEHDIPIIEDLGSGVLIDLSKYGLTYEPTVQDSIRKGADVVCFSGDKLLGGPQAGIIIGKKKYIDQMKKNQLTRALRIDKFTAAALELVLQEYLSEEKAIQNLPVLRMITESKADVEKRARSLKRILQNAHLAATIGMEPCESQIGGGSLPLERIPSMAVTIKPENISVPKLEEEMRHLSMPIIPRTANDTIYLDVRTIESCYFKKIAEMLGELL